MGKDKFHESLEKGAHFMLSRLEGFWEGTARTWFEKEVLADESLVNARMMTVLGQRFLQYTYSGNLQGKHYEGIMVWAYDLENDRCQCSWIDSFHTGTSLLFSEGRQTDKGFEVLGTDGRKGMEQVWRWKTELEILNADQFILRAYHISPEGEEAKAIEVIYLRKED